MWLERYFRFVIRHPLVVLLLCGVLSGLAGWQISRGAFATSLIKSFLGQTEELARYRELRAHFQGGDLMAIAFEDEALFTKPGWARLQRISEALESLPFVHGVVGLPSAYRIAGHGGELELRPYRELAAEAEDHAALRREVLANPALVRTLVAPDGCCTMILIELAPYDEQPVEEMPASLDAMLAPFLAEGLAPERLHLAGLYAETVEGVAESRYSVLVIFPFTAAILLLAIYLLFGRMWPVLITGVVALVGTTWTFAVAVALDREINLLMAMVPAVTMIISFSDVIHLCSRYLHFLGSGTAKLDAISGSARDVGSACVYNSVTTAAGFLAMAAIPAPVFRTVGVALALGVLIALVVAMTLVPVLLAVFPAPVQGPRRDASLVDRLLDAIVLGAGRAATRRPWFVIGAFGLLTAVSLAGLAELRFETSMVDRLDSDNRLQQAHRFIRQHFQGTTVLELYAQSEADDFTSPALYRRLRRFEESVKQLPGVDGLQSFTDIVEPVSAALSSSTALGASGRSKAQLAQTLLLAEASGDPNLRRLLDEERRSIRMLARLETTGMANAAALGREIERLAEVMLPEVRLEASGLTKLFGDWIDEIIEGQRRGLWLALLTTTLTMIVCFRRIRTGVVSMIPNVVPLVFLGGLLAFLDPVRDSDLVVIAMITVGTVVDDTIHLVNCLMKEAEKTSDRDRIIERALALSGRSMVKATFVLCAGFLPFALSGYSTTRHMGTFVPLVLALAAGCELLLTPALAKVGALGLGRPPSTRPGAPPQKW